MIMNDNGRAPTPTFTFASALIFAARVIPYGRGKSEVEIGHELLH